MKNLILFAALIPFVSFGQKFELSEYAGYSIINNAYLKNGFSNQIAISYHPVKRFSISTFYELNVWSPAAHALGISSDLNTKFFLAGADLKVVQINPNKPGDNYTVRQLDYYPSLGYGVHIGSKQKILKHLSLCEQIGYGRQYLKGIGTYLFVPSADPINTGVNDYVKESFSGSSAFFYLRIGLSCWL